MLIKGATGRTEDLLRINDSLNLRLSTFDASGNLTLNTGLRLFNIRCAWFDHEHYYEFFPLHVVYKKKGRKKAKPAAVHKDQKTFDELFGKVAI